MLVRFRAADGQFRVQVEPTDTMGLIQAKLVEQLPKNVDPNSLRISDQPANGLQRLFREISDITVQDAALKHGDLLFLFYDKTEAETPVEAPQRSGINRVNGGAIRPDDIVIKQTTTAPKTLNASEVVKQDPLDDLLDKQDGKIHRPRDPTFCRHAAKGMCDHCMPLEPYDPKYLEEKKIKHLSFHAYLRQINTATNKPENPSSFVPPLQEPYYRVKQPCPSGHPAWPEGICSKCQPSAITLKPQTFRMVDHVEFSDPSIVDSFINFWRSTGTQRLGYLYGRYEPYTEVPLGIKAVVEAIYEPPQHNEADGLTLSLPWEDEKGVDAVAELCGLRKVGVIFTDLVDDGTGSSKVVCKRHIDSYYLSSLEIQFAARLQAENPHPSKWSDTGRFGSNFVTVVISGNEEGAIEISPYQVSVSGVEMVRADIVEPCADPGKMLVCPEDENRRYIPEVFYRKIDKYGASVQENAKPAFPVEYLLVTLTHGFPHQPKPLFVSEKKFPVENRAVMGQSQDLKAVATQLGVYGKSQEEELSAISDFHFLNYIHTLDILAKNEEALLAKAATSHEYHDIAQLVERPGWQTLLAILKESGERPPKRGRLVGDEEGPSYNHGGAESSGQSEKDAEERLAKRFRAFSVSHRNTTPQKK
ncbi:nuclear protein localization protein 4 [Ascobolus immersus RN42]|uniref:Nuclear protein localization protein 4 n=1 Tax=Ascobolus immersus RN42 TaxID=1160509 RepID=A0A3N4ILF3_ASCIM|nr:nuclear protein localization protein 4 [Ascobolus immersus RN42]